MVDYVEFEKACFSDVCSAAVALSTSACRTVAGYALKCLQFPLSSEQKARVVGWKSNARFNGNCGKFRFARNLNVTKMDSVMSGGVC